MEPIFLYLIGAAGSGKSSLVSAFKLWMDRMGFNASTINLDPGVEHLAYAPDIDVREWFSLTDVMEEYGLGPNGAQILAADMVALRVGEMKGQVEDLNSDYYLIDTPGQMELFTFRECSRIIVRSFDREHSAVVFLYDPMLSSTPSSFVSQLLLGSTTQFRFFIPSLNVLTKVDLLEEEKVETILEWSRNSDALFDALVDEAPSISGNLNIELFKALETLGVYKELMPTSAEEMTGIEDIYNMAQQVFMGGEDLATD